MESREASACIMIVDDMLENRKLLGHILEEQGYTVRHVNDGPAALRSTASDPPDLILLDIRMPEMDGFEVCRKMKADPAMRDIPILFLSALRDTKDKVQGFQIGGVDYITKPFQPEEVLARIKTHLNLKLLRKAQEQYNKSLEKKILERTRELSASESRYRRLVEDLPVGIFRTTFGESGAFLMANSALVKMFGYDSKEDFMQTSVEDCYRDPAVRRCFLKALQEEGTVRGKEIEFKRRDNTPIIGSISAHAVVDDNDEILYVDGIIEDITEQKILRRQFSQVQKMEAIGTLAGGIAHDFNNILSGIFGFTQLAIFEADEGKNNKAKLEEVLKAGLRARALIKQIMTFSRKSETIKQPIEIDPIIKETIKLLRASLDPKIHIRHHLKNSKGNIVNADATQIYQILMNIGTNAAHALRRKGGDIEIILDEVFFDRESHIGYQSIMPGAYLSLSIHDSGHGIQPEHLDRIFDPFFTTKKPDEGTGMGLSVVHGIVKDLGGAISVSSKPGQGTTFFILIPKWEGPSVTETDARPVTPSRRQHILLVDDEKPIIESMQEILEHYGYTITSVDNSREALTKFQSNPEAFDLLLTDLLMPEIDGLDLSKRILETRPKFPIVLCTGFNADIVPESLKKIGIRQMIYKPVIAEELAQVIEAALEKS